MLRVLEVMLRELEKIAENITKERVSKEGGDDVIKEVTEEVIRIKREAMTRNNAVEKVTRAVAMLLELEADLLLKEVLKREGCLVESCIRQDEVLAVEDMIERIVETLTDSEAWDAYHASRSPSAYKYASAVVLWMLLARYHLGGLIRADCPIFSKDVFAAITDFLVSRYAEPLADAISNAVDKTSRQYNKDIASLCVKSQY